MSRNESIPSGLILLNKKAGITSFEALGEIKRALNTGKVGHTGTLDKFASGLLLVLVGRALKLSPWFSRCDKQYLGTVCFGIETDTLDPEGSIIAEAAVPSREQAEQALSQFTGAIMQEPPAYSAIHVNGKRASELARSGKAPEMKKRPVHIHKLELRSWEPSHHRTIEPQVRGTQCAYAEIFVHCSSGTYIRSLARDIALAAGSRAHLSALTRTQVAGFRLEDAVSLKNEELGLQPISRDVFKSLGIPLIEVDQHDAEKIIHSKPLSPVLDGKTFLPCETSAKTGDFSASCNEVSRAAIFFGETLVAIVERIDGKWKYGCVLGE